MHRNIANIISPTDINTAAVIEYSVAVLKVKHVVLCGHTCCGGAAAALGDGRVGGVLDTWLTPLKAIRNIHREELESIQEEKDRAIRIAELNVQYGVKVLMANITIQEAIKERGLELHGCIFDLTTGRLKDLGCGTSKAIAGSESQLGDLVRVQDAQLVIGDSSAKMTIAAV